MPTYIAFLRAINLGARRRFPTADIVAATQAAGGSDVATHLATGNVRLTSPLRPAAQVEAALADAYARDRGFEVPTIVLTPAELREITQDAQRAVAQHPVPVRQVLVTILAAAPTPEAVRAAEEWGADDPDSDIVRVHGRAAHALLQGDIHSSKLMRAKAMRDLGDGTSRNLRVLATLVDRWT